MGDFEPPHWAQLWDPAGGVHLNIQGEEWYVPPTWPERAGEPTHRIAVALMAPVFSKPKPLRRYGRLGAPPRHRHRIAMRSLPRRIMDLKAEGGRSR
jgi:hypothetical protein